MNKLFTALRRLITEHPYLCAFLFALVAAAVSILTHPSTALVSFDEGFHGGGALYYAEVIRTRLGLSHGPTHYLLSEFFNGVAVYPPTWALFAGIIGVIFTPSVFLFRFVTILFYVALLMTTFGIVFKITNRKLIAFSAMGIIATIPTVVIYSHLMMLEVPLICTLTAAIGGFYLYVNNLIPRKWYVVLFICFAFAAATLTKMAAIYVLWGTLSGFIVLSSLLYLRSKYYKVFFKPEIILFFFSSLLALYAFQKFEAHYLSFDLLKFHTDQSVAIAKTMGYDTSGGTLSRALHIAWDSRRFYLTDMMHMPWLMWLWLGSAVFYPLYKRTPFALLLSLWSVVSYGAFSAVFPQVVQYVGPIYAPLAIVTALSLYEVLILIIRVRKFQSLTVGLVTCAVMAVQIYATPLSEAYGWRDNRSEVVQAAQYIADHAVDGDRVISWNDGTTFATQVEGMQKHIQVQNALQQMCKEAMQDSYNWAIVTAPDVPALSATDTSVLSNAPWEIAGRYGAGGETVLYHNTNASLQTLPATSFDPAHLVPDSLSDSGNAQEISEKLNQPAFWGCYRLLPVGDITTTFYIRATSLDASIPDTNPIAAMGYYAYPGGEEASRTITAGELRASEGFIAFPVVVHHDHSNLQGEFKITITTPVTLHIEKIVESR